MSNNVLLITLERAFDRLLLCSSQAALVIALVLVVRMVVGRRLQARWMHALWLIVLVRLMLPWAPSSRLSIFGMLPHPHASAIVAPATDSDELADTTPRGLLSAPRAIGAAETAQTALSEPFVKQHAEQRAWQMKHILYAAWLMGTLVFGGALISGYVRFASAIGRERFVTDQSTLDLLEECKQRMGVRTLVGVVVTDRVQSPALFGFVRPRLLLPPGLLETLPREGLRHVFLHELGHLQRHDVVFGWLMGLASVLHWCNPLVWIAQHRMRADRELACDARVLSIRQAPDPHAYGQTIVRLLEQYSAPQYLPSLTGILESRQHVKRRIAMIASFHRSPASWVLGPILLVTLACSTLTDASGPGQPAAPGDQKPGAAAQSKDSDTSAPRNRYVPGRSYSIFPGSGMPLIALGETASQIEKIFGRPEQRRDFGNTYKLDYQRLACIDFLLSTQNDRIIEIRFNPGYRGRLRNGIGLGSELEAVLSKSGGASKTVEAESAQTHGVASGTDRVLYKQIVEGKPSGYKFVDGKQGILYWFDKDKALTQIVVFAPEGKERRRGRPDRQVLKQSDLPEGSRIDEHGVIVEKIDYPFVRDPAAVGQWESVDYLDSPEEFNVDKPQTPKADLFLKGMVFEEDGKANYGFAKWTKGLMLSEPNKTASRYLIKEIGGTTYLFMEWKSGDYTIRHWRPSWYVFKKVPAGVTRFKGPRELMDMSRESEEAKLGPDSHIDENDRIIDRTDYPFVDDPQVVGRWQSVDFVRRIEEFDPDQPNWKGDLFLKDMEFNPGGKLGPGRSSWTKGLILSPEGGTASKYEIKEIGGQKYLFREWKSGDYKILHRKPAYYVLKQAGADHK